MQTFGQTSQQDKDHEDDNNHGLTADMLEAHESCTVAIENKYRSARNAVDWILYALHHDTSMPVSIACFIFVVEAFQWASFAFFPKNLFGWNHGWSNWLARATDYGVNFLGQNMSGFYAAIAITLSYYVLAALAVWAQRYLRWTWVMSGYRFCIQYGLRILLLPVMGAFARMLFGCINRSEGPHAYYNQTCGDAITIIYMTISVICMMLYFFVAFLTALCYVELNPNQRLDLDDRVSAFARATGRGDTLNLLARTCCIVFFVVFSQFATPEWPLAGLLFVSGCVNFAYQIYLLPYYNRWVQIFAIWSAIVPAWTGLCTMITQMQSGDHYGALLLVYCIWPILFMFAIFIHQARIDQVISYSPAKLVAPELYELKARLTLSEGMRTFGLDKPWLVLDNEQEVYRAQLYKEAESTYQLGVKRFPNDHWLHIHFSCYYSYYVQNKPMAFREMVSAAANASAPDVRFFLFLMRARSNVESALQRTMDVQVKSYTEFKDRSVMALNASRTAARTMLEFWTELMRATPNTDRLVRLAAVGRTATLAAYNNFKRLLEINPHSIVTLRCFGGFVLDFNGDITMSSQLLHRADELEESRSTMTSNASSELTLFALQRTNLDIYDERNAVLSISLEKDSFANIVTCNGGFRRLMGYNLSSELLNHNVNNIIPEPVRTVHDTILNAFLHRNHSDILNTTRVALCVHKRGHVFPVDINLRWADATMSRVIGVMKPIVTEEEQILFDKSSDHVNYCTLNCYAWFGVTREMVMSKDVHMSGIFPHLSIHRAVTGKDRRRREFLLTCANGPQGLILPAKNYADCHLFLVRLWIYTLQVHDVFVTVCRLSRKVDREHLLSNANVIGFTEAERTGHGLLDYDADALVATTASYRWRRPEEKTALKLTTRGWLETRSALSNMNEFDRSALDIDILTGTSRCVEDYSEEALKEVMSTVSVGSEEDEDDEDDDQETGDPSNITSGYSFIAGPTQPQIIMTSGVGQVVAPGRSASGAPLNVSGWRNGFTSMTVINSPQITIANKPIAAAGLTRTNISGAESDNTTDSDEAEEQDMVGQISSTNLRDVNAPAKISKLSEASKSGQPTKAQQRLAASALSLIETQSVLKTSTKSSSTPTDEAGSDKALLTNLRAGALANSSDLSKSKETKEAAETKDKRVSDPLLTRGFNPDDSGSENDSVTAGGAGGSLYSDATSGSSAYDNESKIAGNRHILNFIREQNEINSRTLWRAHLITAFGVFVILGVMIAMYVVSNNAIVDNDLAVTLLVYASHRRHLSMSLHTVTGAMELARLGFYDNAYFLYAKTLLATAVAWFRGIDEALYHDHLMTQEGLDYFYKPSIPFKILVGGTHSTRLYNLKEYSEAYIAAASMVVLQDISQMDSENAPYMYMVTQNALTTAPEAYRKAIEYLKVAVDAIYVNLLITQLIVFIVVLCVVIAVLLYVNIKALRFSAEQNSDVKLLFLSLPKSVVKLLQKRFATALKNQSDEDDEAELLEVTKTTFGSQDDLRDDLSDASTSVSSLADTEYTDGSGARLQDNGEETGLSAYLSRHRVTSLRQEHMRTALLHSRLIIALKYFLLVSFFIIYVAVLLVTLDSVRAHNDIATGDIENSAVRTHGVAGARYYMRRWATGLEPLNSTKITDYLDLVEETTNKLLYSNTLRFQGSHDIPQREFTFELSCPSILKAEARDVPLYELAEAQVDCDTYLGGIMKNGIQEAFTMFYYLAYRLAQPMFHNLLAASLSINAGKPGLEPVGTAKYNAVMEYVTTLYTLGRTYIETALAYSTTLYGTHALQVNSNFTHFCKIWFACWFSGILLYCLVVLRPIYGQLHESVRASHAMMLAIPPDVALKVTQVSKFLQDAFDHAQGVRSEVDYDTK